jgi:hypothetical protein
MMDQPSLVELVEAVRHFLEQRALPELNGHTKFHARVAANALGIVARELAEGPAAFAREAARLRELTGEEGAPAELNRLLCQMIREGRIALDDPRLVAHLEATASDKIAIDQPGYAEPRAARS